MSSFNRNNLSHCPSPYLQQHANNPVFWQEWTTQVLDHARSINKPILLSIGYSACHWCHVMEAESFSDQETANIMNQHFINIKVDREERPDLDKLFQQCHQLLNHRAGGWPLTVFIDPKSLMPFFIGTYFSNRTVNNQPSFQQILATIKDIYECKYTDVENVRKKVTESIEKLNVTTPESYSLKQHTSDFVEHYLQNQDEQWGGLQGAPKFPQPQLLSALLHIIQTKRPVTSEKIYQALMRTAQSMSRIGLFDHLSGGFFRYCVDEHWGVPHFEKMLYDNALLINFYADLAKFSKEGFLAEVCYKTYSWLVSEMSSDNGGFYSAINADSNGKEGTFYVFEKNEVRDQLTEEEWKIAELSLGLSQPPNFNNQWHIQCWYSDESLAEKLSIPLKQVQWALEPIKQKLLSYRNKREKPSRDEKILTGWNALLVTGLLKAGQLLNNEDIINTANDTLVFIHQNLWQESELYSCLKDGRAYQKANVDDFAYLMQALMTSLKYEWSNENYRWLCELCEQCIHRFLKDTPVFNFSDAEDLPMNVISLADDALPSGNGLILQVLIQLARLQSDKKIQNIVHQVFEHSTSRLKLSPLGYPSILRAMLDFESSSLIVIRGLRSEGIRWQQTLNQKTHNHYVLFIANDESLPESLEAKYPKSENNCYAIVCDQTHCSAPINEYSELENTLFNKKSAE
ncbi:thioredoxin domain-containing protein [Pleionea sediminis]|uniref:thioredoxin domain-containing protein n=1 Tax=Pleionea sediminis TaxID=2569479 RepID=UPI0013DDDB05|nr:thioredoxin domain-containing protein [Pleionea sediminis]